MTKQIILFLTTIFIINFASAQSSQTQLYQYKLEKIEAKLLKPYISVKDSAKDLDLRGWYHFKLDHIDKAKADFYTSISLDPFNQNTYYDLGVLFIKLKQFDSAFKMLDVAISSSEKRDKLYELKGNCLAELKRYKEAVSYFTKAVELDSNYSLAFITDVMHTSI